MELFRYDREVAGTIEGLEAVAQVPLGSSTGEAHVSVVHLDAVGGLPAHEAPTPQLFVVVNGQGWVSGQDGERHPVAYGDAAFWRQGELHESGTDSGMTAVVVQAMELNIAAPGA